MSSQVRKEKMLRDILVVKSDTVYKDIWADRPWFIAYDEANFEELILENYEYQQRGKMEEDTSFQQPIPYVLIHNKKLNKFVWYQRGSLESVAWEKRLFGQWSLWVWGHIEKEQEWDKNPIYTTLFKEIEEEIWLTDISNVQVLWYIVDKTVPVNLYHLWVVYVVETHTDDISVVDGELEQVFYLSSEEIDNIIDAEDANLESRSEIAWNAYRSHFNK